MDILLKCRCGLLRGVATDTEKTKGLRIVCYCDDCQTYAYALGKPETVLDSHGGTEVFTIVPAHLKLTRGIEYLRCLRLSPKGLYRWYAGCCKTPIGNMMSEKMPYVGLIHTAMDLSPTEREEILGPIREGVQGKFAKGGLPEGVSKSASIGIILATIRFVLMAKLRKQNQPQAFFKPSGEPVVDPEIVSLEERNRLRSLL